MDTLQKIEKEVSSIKKELKNIRVTQQKIVNSLVELVKKSNLERDEHNLAAYEIKGFKTTSPEDTAMIENPHIWGILKKEYQEKVVDLLTEDLTEQYPNK